MRTRKFFAMSLCFLVQPLSRDALAREPEQVPFTLKSAPGFRLTNPSYRAVDGALRVSVEVCRIVGWAGSVPAEIHFERDSYEGMAAGHRDVGFGRMGTRGGENCERSSTTFEGLPHAAEHITICIAGANDRTSTGNSQLDKEVWLASNAISPGATCVKIP